MKKILNDKFIGKLIKSFIEGFIASLIVSLNGINDFNDINLIRTILVGAIAMGISAVLNLIQSKLLEGNQNE